MSNRGERGERSKLWVKEHVIELRRSITDRARRAAWSIVPEQLQKRVIADFSATDRFRRDKSVGRLRRCQRCISPKTWHVGEQVIEEWNVRDRVDCATCIPVPNECVNRIVVGQSRLWIANVVELHDVARGEQVASPATNVACFERQTLTDLTTVREVETVVVRSCDSLVQRDFDALIFVRWHSQRKCERCRDRTRRAREGQRTNAGVQAGELRSKVRIDHVKRVSVDVT